MKNFAQMNMTDLKEILVKSTKKITKKQIIIIVVLIAASYAGYAYSKVYREKQEIVHKAQKIIAEIAENQKEYFTENKKYDKEYFEHHEQNEDLYSPFSMEGDSRSLDKMGRRNFYNAGREINDPSTSQIGDFYVEIDADNACMVLKYKRNTRQKTIFAASFDDAVPLCSGKKCLRKDLHSKGNVCYKEGECFQPFLSENTTKPCGNNHGLQTRECKSSCDGGTCADWGECVCSEGYGWNGTTCTQLQTEKDCTAEQCFNGLMCQNKEPLEKEIEGGTCQRNVSCQKEGWKYTDWECTCKEENLCSLKDECVTKPEEQKTLELPNQQGICYNISYTCKEGEGWQTVADKCTCKNIGYFWDKQAQKATCSTCTQKPENSYFTSAGTDKDDCAWKCDVGFENRNGTCSKPNGQYVCAKMNLEICTDDFSKERKLNKDTNPNEGQSCFTEDNENILFYTPKTQTCILCQCFDFNKVK